MYLFQLYLVTMATFVVQRSRRSPPSMVYTTFENTLDQQKVEAMSTSVHALRFHDYNERTDKLSTVDQCLG